jgi:hypothetical protein
MKKQLNTIIMLIKSTFRIVAVASAILLVSCQSSNKPAGEQTAADSLNKEQVATEVKAVVYPLPTPFEMTKMLNDIGASYVVKVLNSPENVEKYFTEKDKAVNLGVYGADLAYTTTYNKEQDVKMYMKSVKSLIDALGINIDYSPLLADDVKIKANDKDTLTKIITNTFFDTYSFLNEKSNPELSVMMVSGMWVELMYIATHISKDTYNNTQIVNIIGKQKESYTKLMELLSKYNTNADIKDLQSKLEALKPAFDKVDSGLQEKDYKVILSTIETVRKSFVTK